MNCTLLPVGTPPTVTSTLPLTAVAGTMAVMLESLQAVAVALTFPLEARNCSVLVPCVAPNPLPLTWTVVHPIDDNSPLKGVSPTDLESRQSEFLILIKAYDDTFSQTVHARYSYTHNELVYGAKFNTAFSIDKAGDVILDIDKVGDFSIVD